MSKTKQGGSSRLGRESASQRLGIKAHDGEKIKIGQIIVRQRGSKILAGKNVKVGSDDTIYAMKDGTVKFSSKTKKLYDGSLRSAKIVSVEPAK
ncbi:MAG: 50S ribosomal protein L27 [Candidatus Staskawiczbacteria bacterium]|jgi:large subunit ribosomal protein L27